MTDLYMKYMFMPCLKEVRKGTTAYNADRKSLPTDKEKEDARFLVEQCRKYGLDQFGKFYSKKGWFSYGLYIWDLYHSPIEETKKLLESIGCPFGDGLYKFERCGDKIYFSWHKDHMSYKQIDIKLAEQAAIYRVSKGSEHNPIYLGPALLEPMPSEEELRGWVRKNLVDTPNRLEE